MNPSIRNVIVVAALTWSMGAFAQAMSCSAEIKKLDEALTKAAKVDPPKADEARKLSQEAKTLLGEKKESECLQVVERAKALLQIA